MPRTNRTFTIESETAQVFYAFCETTNTDKSFQGKRMYLAWRRLHDKKCKCKHPKVVLHDYTVHDDAEALKGKSHLGVDEIRKRFINE